jgi:broad-specificity NMP kinase
LLCLSSRGYSEVKVRENVECEIMQVVLDEARESYDHSIVKLMDSNTLDNLEANVITLVDWLKSG